jgi:tetratricopeptide (TPR) repeat protein
MQAHWFFQESGMCFYNLKQYAKALEMFKVAMEHYNEYKSTEFDFHQFNHRICSLISEVEMINSTDNFFKHKDYFISATKSIEILLKIHFEPQIVQQYKEQQKNEEEEKKNIEKLLSIENTSTPFSFPEKPLEEAHKICKTLEKYNSHRIETHLLSFQISMERKKYMLALKSLKAAFFISPLDDRLQVYKVLFFSFVPQQQINPTLLKVIETESKLDSGLSGLTPLQVKTISKSYFSFFFKSLLFFYDHKKKIFFLVH